MPASAGGTSAQLVDLREFVRAAPALAGPERGDFERFANVARARGVLALGRPGYRLKLGGTLPNHDTMLKLQSVPALI